MPPKEKKNDLSRWNQGYPRSKQNHYTKSDMAKKYGGFGTGIFSLDFMHHSQSTPPDQVHFWGYNLKPHCTPP
jgi:hypothetical protein